MQMNLHYCKKAYHRRWGVVSQAMVMGYVIITSLYPKLVMMSTIVITGNAESITDVLYNKSELMIDSSQTTGGDEAI